MICLSVTFLLCFGNGCAMIILEFHKERRKIRVDSYM